MNPHIETFFGWLLRASWQAAALAILVMAAQVIFRKKLSARWRYALWLLVVARLALPVSPPSPMSIFNYARLDRLADKTVARLAEPARPVAALDRTPPAPAAPANLPEILPATPTAPALSRVLAPTTAPRPQMPQPPPAAKTNSKQVKLNWPVIGATIWLAGVLFLLARVTKQNAVFLRQLRQAREVSDAEMGGLLEECRRSLGVSASVRLAETEHIRSPALYGLFAPRMLLPAGLRREFTREELRHVFLHEMAHLKRHDMAVHCVAGFLNMLNWFNPVLWFAFRRMAADRELACDELALSCAGEGEKSAYGQTIIKLLEECARPAALPGLVGILEDKSQMRRRILMIAGFKPARRWSLLAGAILVALGLVALTDAQVKNATAPENPGSPPKTWSGTVLFPNSQVIATDLHGEGIRDEVVSALGAGQTNQAPEVALDGSVTDTVPLQYGRPWVWPIDVALPINGTVLLPNGKPAAGATVAVCGDDLSPLAVAVGGMLSSDRLQLNGTRLTTRMSEWNLRMLRQQENQNPNLPPAARGPFERMFPALDYTNGPIVLADAEGKFRVAKKRGQYLFASHEGGSAGIGPGRLESPLTIQLEPWGRIEGTVRDGGALPTNVCFALGPYLASPIVTQGSDDFLGVGPGIPDGAGRFTFTNVVPGEYTLQRVVTIRNGSTNFGFSRIIAHLDVKAGEVTRLEVEDTGSVTNIAPPNRFGRGFRRLPPQGAGSATNNTPSNSPPRVPPSSRGPSNEPSAINGTVLLPNGQPGAAETNADSASTDGVPVSSSKPPAKPSGLSLVIRCTNDVLKLGDKISIEFILSNHGTADYKYYQFSGYDGNCELSATTSSGMRVPDPRSRYLGDPLGSGSGPECLLRPGEFTTNAISLNRWALMKEPGSYEVTGIFVGDIFNSLPTVRVRAAPISITVLPRTKEEMHE